MRACFVIIDVPAQERSVVKALPEFYEYLLSDYECFHLSDVQGGKKCAVCGEEGEGAWLRCFSCMETWIHHSCETKGDTKPGAFLGQGGEQAYFCSRRECSTYAREARRKRQRGPSSLA